MKLINTNNKALSKILEGHIEADFFDAPEEEDHKYPCWEIKVDLDRGELVFLLDAQEQYAHSLKKLKPENLTIENINKYMKIFRTNDLKALAKVLNE